MKKKPKKKPKQPKSSIGDAASSTATAPTKATTKAKAKRQGKARARTTAPSTATTKDKKKKKTKKKARARTDAPTSKTRTPQAAASAIAVTKPRPKTPKQPARGVPAVLSCGLLVWQRTPVSSVLALLRDDGSPDLPKGHVKRGETDVDAALREFTEETGIAARRVRVHRLPVYAATYRTRSKKTGQTVNKTVRVFLAEIDGPVTVTVVDHMDYAWLRLDDAATLEREIVDNPTFLGAVRALLPPDAFITS